MKNDILAIYPGSFDPLTNGHLDIIKRAGRLFSKLIVAVTKNANKNHLFSLDERVSMLKETCQDLSNIEILSFSGLLADYFAQTKADVLIRGLRAISDFEYEFQMASINRQLNDNIETVFLMPEQDYTFLSSNVVREIALLGGETQAFVPDAVEKRLKALRQKQ